MTDRDRFTFQSDWPVKPWLQPLVLLHYEDTRGADLTPALRLTADRHHLGAAVGFTGTLLRSRLFYQATGEVDHSPLLGYTGSPRVGLTYAAVQPGRRRLRGTVLHATAAAGSREPSLLERAATLNITSPRSRSLDFSVDQTILPGKLTARAGYFHQQFSHEFEYVAYRVPLQTLGFRTQGLETQLDYRPAAHLLLRGGYTYLAALVEQSAARPSFNPSLPSIAIGALTALPGAAAVRSSASLRLCGGGIQWPLSGCVCAGKRCEPVRRLNRPAPDPHTAAAQPESVARVRGHGCRSQPSLYQPHHGFY